MSKNSKKKFFDFLWRQYFKDPLQWWDNRRTKKGPQSPDFSNKFTKEPLWIDARDNPAWVGEELRKRGLVVKGERTFKEAIHDKHDVIDEGRSLVSLLRICAQNKDLQRGVKAHDDVLKKGLLEECSGALITMYAKCGELAKAKEMLDVHKSKDLISWTALIAGYAKQGQSKNALSCFEQMRQKGVSLDGVAYAYILKVCASLQDLDKGEQLHNEIAKRELMQTDVLLGTALIDMYAKCGALTKAKEVLESLSVRDVFSWTALITGYAHQEQNEDALRCFERMQQEGHSPDEVTYACILKACGNFKAIEKGEEIHDEILRQGLLRRNIVLGTALVDMYAKCGDLAKAQQVLQKLPVRDVVAWNALIAGYAQDSQGEQALDCFELMQKEGLSPNAITFACILKACGSIGAIWKGEEIHDKIVEQGLLENNIMLCTALVDMYARCGALLKAQRTLEELPSRGIATWNALIAGYTQQGQCKQALNCLERMGNEGLSPNSVTFSCVLNACSHLGLVEDGQTLFTTMIAEYGVEPVLEHYTCMVDLFGRAGHLGKAVEFIKLMPSYEYSAIWRALLGACRKWEDPIVGNWAFQQAIHIDKSDPAPYLLMSNIYAGAGMQEEAESIEAMRIENQAW
ncbi:hypothetical protein GOP47_0004558 [Adiantum capillus-veneris]|uniref:Pentatricopeptide repeat-containing protein n=1 Tax=Adiantum capillus-veneris TaxID=13818 RepID=A0A9D4V7N6_ADICA|nr:hypothetical protein GOP47_0004558 [Adiantum capillus-veneris]